MTYIDLIGYIAAFLIAVAFIPQAIQTIRTKDVDGISLPTFSIVVLASCLWATYGWLKQDWPIIITNVVLFFVQGLILICKIKYGKKGK